MQSSSTQLIAQAVYNPQLSDSLRNLSGWEFINNIVPYFVLLGFIIGVLAFFFMLVIGGVQWITSGGDKARVEDARRKITHAFIGLFLLFIIYAIVRLINILFGIDIGGIGTRPPTPTPTPPPGACSIGYFCHCTGGIMCAPGYHTECSGVCSPCDIGLGEPGQCCTCVPDAPCTTNSDCESNFCSDGADIDGDAYYAPRISGTGICQNGPADCNDNNSNVHPNQWEYFEDPIPGSSNNFNYDCADSDGDGDPHDKWPRLDCLSPGYLACQLTPFTDGVALQNTGWTNGIQECGTSLTPGPGINEFRSCFAYANDTCTMFPGDSQFDCSIGCITGNVCGVDENEPCVSWIMTTFPVFSSYVDGFSRMPCK